MIFISYFTKDTPYEEVMKTHLYPSLERWKLKHCILGIEDFGNWAKNTSYKPTFILYMMNKYKEDIVFLDADATIHAYPQLLFDIPSKYDLACHYFDWYLHWRKQEGNPKRDLLSGTMFIRYNQKTLNLLNQYIAECEAQPGKWEQKVLQDILEKRNDINVYHLPVTYCTVVGRNNRVPDYVDNPVIVHHQVSRKYK